MDATRRKAAPSDQIKTLTDTNALLTAESAQLKRAVTDLENKNKFLKVIVAILLASNGGSGVGLATSMSGATAQTALISATGVFFSVIIASIAIMTFMHRSPQA